MVTGGEVDGIHRRKERAVGTPQLHPDVVTVGDATGTRTRRSRKCDVEGRGLNAGRK